MQGAPSLAAMREELAAIAARGLGMRTFGVMFCQECACSRTFVSTDAHTQHITDAECQACGYSYGRIDIPETSRGVLQPDGTVAQVVTPSRKRVPVISDGIALAAKQALQESLGAPRSTVPAPRSMPQMPADDAGSDDSRVSSYLRGQR